MAGLGQVVPCGAQLQTELEPAPAEVVSNAHPDFRVQEGELVLYRLLARSDQIADGSDRVARGGGPGVARDRLQDEVDPVGRPLSGLGNTHAKVICPGIARVPGDVLDLVVRDLGMRLPVQGRRGSEAPSTPGQGLGEAQMETRRVRLIEISFHARHPLSDFPILVPEPIQIVNLVRHVEAVVKKEYLEGPSALPFAEEAEAQIHAMAILFDPFAEGVEVLDTIKGTQSGPREASAEGEPALSEHPPEESVEIEVPGRAVAQPLPGVRTPPIPAVRSNELLEREGAAPEPAVRSREEGDRNCAPCAIAVGDQIEGRRSHN